MRLTSFALNLGTMLMANFSVMQSSVSFAETYSHACIFIKIVLMESKLNSIIEACKHLEYEQAARLIDQLESKRAKAKTKLTQEQEYTLLALKGSSLLRLGRYGEAHRVSNLETANLDKLQPNETLPVLIDNARELQLWKKETELIGIIEKQKQKLSKDGEQYPLLKAYINTRRFNQASVLSLKIYDSTKSVSHLFWQIYLLFLEVLNKNNLLLTKRQSIIKTKPGIQWQMIKLFWTKFLTLNKIESFIQKKSPIFQDVIIFHVRSLITQQDQPSAFDALGKYQQHISDPITVANLYKSAYQLNKSQQATAVIISSYEKVFRKNMDVVNYKPLYDLYNEYLGLLLGFKEGKLEVKDVGREERFNSAKVPKAEKLNFYLSCLAAEYRDVSMMKIDTRLDYYKTCLKTLLLQIISIYNTQPDNKDIRVYFDEFIKHFGKTLTFCEEFIVICSNFWEISLDQEGYTAEHRCILDINKRKLQYLWGKQKIPTDEESLHQLYEQYYKLYKQTLVEIDKERILEKGERYLADEYIVILSDIFREYFESSPSPLSTPMLNLLLLLQHCSKKSYYNYSFKLRLIFFYDRLNLCERVLNIYETLDIKSVQFETLGYLVYNSITAWGQQKEFEELLMRAIKSYQDNSKEIKQYTYKCLDRNKLANLEEFLSYDQYVSRSYSKLVLWAVVANKFRGTINQQFLIRKVLETLMSDKKLVFNCDYKRLQSTVNNKRQYCSFFGPFNNRDLFANDCALRLEQLELLAGKYESKPVQIKEVGFASVLDFSQFEFLREEYIYRLVKSSEEQVIERTYECLVLLHKIQLIVNQIARAVLTKQPIFFDKQLQDINECLTILDKFKTQPRDIMLIQRKLHLPIKLINETLSSIAGKKKKKDEEKKLGESLRNLMDNLYKLICSYEPKHWPEFKIWDKSLESELKQLEIYQDRLQKLASMNPKQYDGLYRIN